MSLEDHSTSCFRMVDLSHLLSCIFKSKSGSSYTPTIIIQRLHPSLLHPFLIILRCGAVGRPYVRVSMLLTFVSTHGPSEMAFNTPRWASLSHPSTTTIPARRPSLIQSFSSACTQMHVCQQVCVSGGVAEASIPILQSDVGGEQGLVYARPQSGTSCAARLSHCWMRVEQTQTHTQFAHTHRPKVAGRKCAQPTST